MAPAGKVPGSTATSAEGWEVWWREYVMRELVRLDANTDAVRSEFEAECRAIRKEVSDIDKTSAVDIRDLQVRAAIGGGIGGSIAGLAVGLLLFFIENWFRTH